MQWLFARPPWPHGTSPGSDLHGTKNPSVGNKHVGKAVIRGFSEIIVMYLFPISTDDLHFYHSICCKDKVRNYVQSEIIDDVHIFTSIKFFLLALFLVDKCSTFGTKKMCGTSAMIRCSVPINSFSWRAKACKGPESPMEKGAFQP